MIEAVTRGIAFLCLGSLAWSQSLVSQKAFLRAVESLDKPAVDGTRVDPRPRIQREIGVSTAAADAVLEVAHAYKEEADKIEERLKRSIFTRRLQIAGEYRVTYSSELDLVNWANMDLNLFLLEQWDDLYARMGEEDSEKLERYLEERSASRLFFPPGPGETGGVATVGTGGGWQKSPSAFWRDLIVGPLSGVDPETVFAEDFYGKPFPEESIVPFLEGTVVSVDPKQPLQGRKVVLSMDEEGLTKAALLMDGLEWNLAQEPQPGAVVRFAGVASEFAPEPFLIIFTPQRVDGLSLITKQPNAPFAVPSLAR